jgi:RimJ/RimL family protein N-acetyltransferase
MNVQLFEGERVRLAPHDPDKDAEVESRWTHDPEYMRLVSADPVRPLSPGQIKKKYEEAGKDASRQSQNRFSFAVRMRADDRLIGVVRLDRIEWNNGAGWLALGIGAAEDRGQGYGTEALRLILRYAFDELNLHRLSASTFEYNTGALRFLERAGFAIEVRRRQAIQREGRRWDDLFLGILREDWERLAGGR